RIFSPWLPMPRRRDGPPAGSLWKRCLPGDNFPGSSTCCGISSSMTSVHRLQRSLSDAPTHFLWDPCVSIGVAGATRARPVPFVVDPEALLLATTRFGLGDARLFGEMLDWLAMNGRLLGAQRLKSLHLGSGLGDARVLRAMDRHLAEHVPGSP